MSRLDMEGWLQKKAEHMQWLEESLTFMEHTLGTNEYYTIDENNADFINHIDLCGGFEKRFVSKHSYFLRFKLEISEHYGCEYEDAKALAVAQFIKEDCIGTTFKNLKTNDMISSILFLFDEWYIRKLRALKGFRRMDKEVKEIILRNLVELETKKAKQEVEEQGWKIAVL
jgi:hypothetical protein